MSLSKKLIYINTSPKVNNKADGSQFYTVLVGLNKADNAGNAERITMTVFPNQLEAMTKAFAKAKANGVKLALSCDEIVVTEAKLNTFINSDGVQIQELQASCWAQGPSQLTVVSSTMSISDELRALLGDDDGDDVLA
jgi:uncharacterized protein GlcG (DUF336 family)